jgi:PadR family transcriptional regulator
VRCYVVYRYEAYTFTHARPRDEKRQCRIAHPLALGKLIEARSKGVLKFKVGSLYPLLYRLEKRGWIAGHWVEKPGEKRRRCYKLTKEGKQVLKAQRSLWQSFVAAINQVTGLENA